MHQLGIQARSYTGSQVHILTDSAHNKARILDIDDKHIRSDLDLGKVVVVAGFQGIDEFNNITNTLKFTKRQIMQKCISLISIISLLPQRKYNEIFQPCT